jgi:hypothetical protein
MDNETSVTPEWGAYWSGYIRDSAERRGIKVHTTEMWDPWDLGHAMHRATWEHPETYSFVDISQNNHNTGQTHYDNGQSMRRRIRNPIRPLNNIKIYGADGGRFGDSRDGVERFWRNIFGGMASARFHRPASGIGLSPLAARMIRSARDVAGAFDLFSCEPAPRLLSGHGENGAYCLAQPGRQYALYFPAGGRTTLDASAAAPGGLTLRWYDIDNGGWHDAVAVSAGGDLRLEAPGPGQWAAVLTRAGRPATD